MKLTIEHDRATIRRYGHLRPAKGWGVRRCGARCPGSSRTCTLEAGHRGPHVAHGLFRRVVAVWDSGGAEVAASTDRLRKTLASGTGASIRRGRPEGVLTALWHRVTNAARSLEELSWIVLFVVFLGWVFYWVHLLFRISH